MIYNETEKSLVGRIRPFEGLAYYHYHRAINSDRKNLKRPFFGPDGPATQQLHFNVDEFVELDANPWKIKLGDITRVDALQQSKWNIPIGLSFAGVIGLTGALMLAILVQGRHW